MDLTSGVWLASPLPALYETKLLDKLQGWIWAPEELKTLSSPFAGILPPSSSRSDFHSHFEFVGHSFLL